MAIYTVNIVDHLPIINVVTTNQKVVAIIDTLAFGESQGVPLREVIEEHDTLNFTQDLYVSGVKREHEVDQTLHLFGKVTHVSSIRLKNKLVFTQTLFRIFQEKQNLTFTELFTVDSGSGLLDVLEFTEIFTGNKYLKNILFNDTLNLIDKAVCYNIPDTSRAYDQIYTPNIFIQKTTNLLFTYNNTTLLLRKPSFGNVYKYNYNRQQVETRGKTLIIGANTTYQYKKSVRGLSFTIEYLKQIDRVRLYRFFNDSVGWPIYMTDNEKIGYNVLITTPELEFTQQDINNYSVSFDMEILDYLGPIITHDEMSILNITHHTVHLTN